jgi:hypothetical protein
MTRLSWRFGEYSYFIISSRDWDQDHMCEDWGFSEYNSLLLATRHNHIHVISEGNHINTLLGVTSTPFASVRCEHYSIKRYQYAFPIISATKAARCQFLTKCHESILQKVLPVHLIPSMYRMRISEGSGPLLPFVPVGPCIWMRCHTIWLAQLISSHGWYGLNMWEHVDGTGWNCPCMTAVRCGGVHKMRRNVIT